ncbi:putative B3 domain-containing protein At5g58280 isoform X2 [Capsella rubella]|uniref:putative B3 domain-containing protein At5g58280 isoform X2 n=1 Tax=Capsella rubella TaxID=81985 RepID=UPI000CD5396F|nr:putative B3 domain-containing protein At5g58280 isoform X2 [Capsella rubella]
MAYEEARKLRLQENLKRFQVFPFHRCLVFFFSSFSDSFLTIESQDLGISQISKALLTQIPKKTLQRNPRPIDKALFATAEPRRSSRVRTPISSYRDDVDVDTGPTLNLRRSRRNSSWDSYIARPKHECKFASYEEKVGALKAAEEFQSRLESPHPSFVKSMLRSHVYSCFWLGLPSGFCVDNFSEETIEVVLEDEEGEEYEAVYIGKRTGLSGGWKRFALDHKLDDGDALLFELVEPKRFKIYVFRGNESANLTSKEKRVRARQSEEEDKDVEESGDEGDSSRATKRLSSRLLRKRKA